MQQNRMSRKKPELLGPGGSLSQALWSLEGGADAVYAGWTAFSARSQAENLDLEGFSRLLSLAHGSSRKVYGAFNTLLPGPDIPRVLEVIWQLWFRGLDGVIIQDPGLLAALRRHGPPVDLHASTQLAVQDALGARMARDSGFSRVVLARELTLGEMAEIRQEVPDIELEVFVAGAQCYGASGQCQASLRLLGRSANRGSCAQLCRNRLELSHSGSGSGSGSGCGGTTRDGPPATNGTWFSMNDLDLLDRLAELEKIGIDSLKIEGRMKGPLYARSLCRAWRLCLDSGRGGPDPALVRESLDQAAFAFSREHSHGFSDGPRGERDLINHEWAGATGRSLGKISTLKDGIVTLRLERDVALKDGIFLRGGSDSFRTAVTSLHKENARPEDPARENPSGRDRGRTGPPQSALTHARAGQTVSLGFRVDPDSESSREFRRLVAAWRKGVAVTLCKVSDHSLNLPVFPPWPGPAQEGPPGEKQGSAGLAVPSGNRLLLRLVASGAPGKPLNIETRVESGKNTSPLARFTLTSSQDCEARTGGRGLDQTLATFFAPPPGIEAFIILECSGELDQSFLPPSALKELRRQWRDALQSGLASLCRQKAEASALPGVLSGQPHAEPSGAGVVDGAPLPSVKRSRLSPPGHPLPFLGAGDFFTLEALPLIEIRGIPWRVACLDPLCFQTRSKELQTALGKLMEAPGGQKLLMGMNNLAHGTMALELAAAHPGRIGVFADWLMNLCNPQAVEWLHGTFGNMLRAWMPGAEAEGDGGLGDVVVPGVTRVEWDEDFDPPVFLSRSCFTSRSRGQTCPLDQGKPACRNDRTWKLAQGSQEWQVLVHDCQTYSWLRQVQS